MALSILDFCAEPGLVKTTSNTTKLSAQVVICRIETFIVTLLTLLEWKQNIAQP
jgi:hypothetical protein